MDSEEVDFINLSSDEEVDSDAENFYSGGDAVEDTPEDGGDTKVKNYKILKEEDIKQLRQDDISAVSSLLSVSRGVACTLLYEKNWSLSTFYDEWIAVEPVGRLLKRKSQQEVCNICFEDMISSENSVSVDCRHLFCVDCWKIYITTSINDGPGCLTLRCPEPKCEVAVGLDIVDRLISGDDLDKYYKYLNRSYVERSRARKWCPAPGCDFAVEFDDGEHENYNVTCDCCYSFCWKCTEENHRPVSCETVVKWAEKNTSEADNTSWILAYTKPCPKCKRPIEKNHGCNMMTCESSCRFRFCWVCLEAHGYHSCNKFKEGDTQAGRVRMDAKKYLEHYTHYYERWHSNAKSREWALNDLNRARNEHCERLALLQNCTIGQMQFLVEAWEQIVECRRVLKWTYAYGYYLSMEKNAKNKMNLFEYLQGQAEAALEKLHHCAEKEIGGYLSSERDHFGDFKTKLSSLTKVTRNYFENLVTALENNLCEVETSRRRSSNNQNHGVH